MTGIGRWRGVVATIAPLLVISTISACSSSSPAAPGVTPTPTLAAGSYTLRLDPGTPPDAVSNFCIISGDISGSASAAVPVTVSQQTATWSIQPTAVVDRGLVVTLQVVGSGFEGTASGAVLDGPHTVTLGTSNPVAQVRLNGSATATNTLTGFTSGTVRFSTSGGSGGCQYYRWSLVPR